MSMGADVPTSTRCRVSSRSLFGEGQGLLRHADLLPRRHQLPVGLLDFGQELDHLGLEPDRGLLADVFGDDDLRPGDGGAEAVEQRLGEGQIEGGVPAGVEEEEGGVGLTAKGGPVAADLRARGQELIDTQEEAGVAALGHVGALEDGRGRRLVGVAVDARRQEGVEDPAGSAHVGVGDGEIVAAHVEVEIAGRGPIDRRRVRSSFRMSPGAMGSGPTVVGRAETSISAALPGRAVPETELQR